MNFYEHTLIARQDISPSQIKQIQEKYTKIIENNEILFPEAATDMNSARELDKINRGISNSLFFVFMAN